MVMSLDNSGLATALTHRGHVAEPMGDGLKVNASTEEVGRAALAAGIVLTDLRTGGVGAIPTLVGTGVSFVTAYLSVAWMLRFVARHTIRVFVWYRWALGGALIVGLAAGWLTATGVPA